MRQNDDFVAQLVEQLTLNQWAEGSSPSEVTENKRVSKKYLAPSIYSYPYWRLKSNIRFYKGVFCLFGHPLSFYACFSTI